MSERVVARRLAEAGANLAAAEGTCDSCGDPVALTSQTYRRLKAGYDPDSIVCRPCAYADGPH